MSSTARNVLAVTCLLGVAACATSGNKDSIEYRSSVQTNSGSLAVPPDLVAPTADGRFTVPEQTPGSATASTYANIRNTTPAAASPVRTQMADAGGIRVERAGSQRWLVVPGTTTELWGRVRDFLVSSGFTIQSESPNTLVMETDWAENRAAIPDSLLRRTLSSVLDGLYSTPQRDKFRVRLEPANQGGGVEIYVSHRGIQERYIEERSNNTTWQGMPPDPSLEAEMLVRLMTALGGGTQEASREAVAKVDNQPPRAVLASDASGSFLRIEAPVDRAWRQVGLSLDRVGLVVEDRDRAKGYYLVRYVVQDDLKQEKPGFWSKLAFWRSDKPSSLTGQYRVVVSGDEKQTAVRVQNQAGEADPGASARQILNLLQAELR
ncbi:MAG: outer membrane protein assembly factor BamC [Moraxellaceae bacterium]|nr:outer membrane protein assembly factor BamC [Moraxellaceae bacterium]